MAILSMVVMAVGMFVMPVPMVMPMIVSMAILEQPRGGEVDQQANDRDRDRLVVMDSTRLNQPFD